MPIVFIIVIIVICGSISMALDKLDDFFYYITPYWQGCSSFFSENINLILGGVCVAFSLFYLVYFKPHKAERYFNQYKANLISRQEAICKIADTLYTPVYGIPSAFNSRARERSIKALRKRVQAEEAFIRDLKGYIRTKES